MAGGWREPGVATGSTDTRASRATVTVAGKPSLDIPPGTLNAILKQAGLERER